MKANFNLCKIFILSESTKDKVDGKYIPKKPQEFILSNLIQEKNMVVGKASVDLADFDLFPVCF